MARCKLSASSLVVLALLSLSAAAQSDAVPQRGIQPYGAYHGDSDVVSLVNGRLDLYGSSGEIANLDANLCTDSTNICTTLTVDDSSTPAAEGQSKAQTAQNPVNQASGKNKPKEVELEDVIFNETGGLRADPKAKPGAPGSAENLHDARVAVAEIAERVLGSSHPEREQAPRLLTHETVRDLNAGNKDVARSLDDSLSAARVHSNTTSDAMHFRTGRHKFKSLYGRKGTMYFGPFHDVTGGRRYLTIAP
jgi:hypothetical protein